MLLAIASGHLEVVKLLLAANADVSIPETKESQTPLHVAAAQGNSGTAILSLLLQTRADINAVTR